MGGCCVITSQMMEILIRNVFLNGLFVWFLLTPIPLRYVKTTANATVDHLSKYLALRIALEDRQRDSQSDAGTEKEGGARGEEAAAAAEGTSLKNISEKQYTIYIPTSGGQFSVSTQAYQPYFFRVVGAIISELI